MDGRRFSVPRSTGITSGVRAFGGTVVIEIPGYEIRREISANRRASVYLALQTSLDRDVALKLMAPMFAADPAFTERFLQEARTLASLAHPNIVAVYDVGVAPDSRQYFSMQYLPGGDFAERVAQGLRENDLIATLDGVAQALDYVHQRGLIHRDVRPSNILFDESNAPILTDFGIARAVGASAGSTATDFSALTGHYMSPEQARGAQLDARADLYSLGALTFFGLTGKPPFDGPDGFAVAYAHVFEPIPRLPAGKAHWQALIDRALAKDPAQRFASAREFLDALGRVAQAPRVAEPVSPPPPPLPAAPSSAAPQAAAPMPRVTPKPASLAPAPAPAPSPVPSAQSYATIQGAAPVRPAVAAPASVPAVASALPKAETLPANRSKRGSARAWLALAAVLVLGAVGAVWYGALGKRSAGSTIAPVTAPPPAPVSAAPPAPAASSNPAPEAAGPVAAPGLQSVPAAAAPDVAPAPAADAVAPGASDEFEPTVDLAKLPTVVDPAIAAITWGRGALAGQRLTTPPGNSALDYFQYALKLDPKSKNAKKGIVDIAKKYIELADKGQGSGDLAAYVQLLTQADDVAKTLDEGADVRKDIAARRAKAAEPYLAQAKAAAAAWDKATAKAAFEKALEIDPSSSAARDGVKFVATIGEPGFVFRDKLGDGAAGPELIVLGGGQVAATRRDITRGEFRRYWAAAGRVAFAGKEPNCRDRESIFRSSSDRNWQNPGFEQDDNHPVVCVSWAEAAGFAQWLSRETGKRYRLLSVAEFERIAAGAAADCSSANLADASFNKKFDSRDGAACDDGFAGTAPAGQFPVHGGLFDAGGNVRTWVGACANGAAAAARGCGSYLAKGRSWMSSSKKPPNDGDSFSADVALNTVGFRLARDIEK